MKIKYITIIVLVLSIFISCGKKKEERPHDYLRPASMYYSKQDTTDIYNLVDQYVSYFSAKDLEAAADMLYFVRHDSILPLDETRRAKFIKMYTVLPIYGVKSKGIILNSDRNNEARLTIQVAKNGDLDAEQGVMKFCLNPVVKDGKWYLTLRDMDAEGVEDVYKVE